MGARNQLGPRHIRWIPFRCLERKRQEALRKARRRQLRRRFEQIFTKRRLRWIVAPDYDALLSLFIGHSIPRSQFWRIYRRSNLQLDIQRRATFKKKLGRRRQSLCSIASNDHVDIQNAKQHPKDCKARGIRRIRLKCILFGERRRQRCAICLRRVCSKMAQSHSGFISRNDRRWTQAWRRKASHALFWYAFAQRTQSYIMVFAQCRIVLCHGKSTRSKTECVLSRLSRQRLRRNRSRDWRQSTQSRAQIDGRSTRYKDDHTLVWQAHDWCND